MLLSDKINFNSESINEDKQGNYIMIKESIQQEYII
jgi:hypothetical protein